MRTRSWGFVTGCPRFLGVKVGSPAMTMSILIERLAAIVFGVMSVGSRGKRLSHLLIAVSGSCVGYWCCSCVRRCCTRYVRRGLYLPICRFECNGLF